jgi:hypothetical protein
MPTTHQKLLTLRGTYSQQAQTLRLPRSFPTEREERQNYGQHRCLDDVVHALRFLDEHELTPRQVRVQIEAVLTTLADWKVGYLIDHIRERKRCGLSEVAEWIAEGVIMQIDQIFPALLATFPPLWRREPRFYGHFFQLYHHRQREWRLDQAVPCWQDLDQRTQEFEEIGVVRLDYVGDVAGCLEVIYTCWNAAEVPWKAAGAVYWVRPGDSPGPLSPGDVIVPVLGDAWMVVDQDHFRYLPQTEKRK